MPEIRECGNFCRVAELLLPGKPENPDIELARPMAMEGSG
jgi:hypothetical protein